MLKKGEVLSYQIIGCAYEVFNEIGGSHKEVVYQRASGLALKKRGLKYTSFGTHEVRCRRVINFNTLDKVINKV